MVHGVYSYTRRPLYIVHKEDQLIWSYTLRGLLSKILALLFVITSRVFNFAYQMRHHLKALTILHSTIPKNYKILSGYGTIPQVAQNMFVCFVTKVSILAPKIGCKFLECHLVHHWLKFQVSQFNILKVRRLYL